MAELLEVDGVSFRGMGFGAATRTGRYSLPSRRGENMVLPGRSGSVWVADKPFEEGLGALSIWAVGATNGDVIEATNYHTDPAFVNGTNGYVFSGTSHSTTRSRSGTHSLRVLSSGASPTGNNGTLISDTTGMTFITGSVWVWIPSTNTGTGVGITLGGTGVVGASSTMPTDRDQWTKIFVTAFISTPGTATMSLSGSNVSGESVWFDDIALVAGEKSFNFNGNDPDVGIVNNRWVGTANASRSERVLLDQYIVPPTMEGRRIQFEANMRTIVRLFTRGHRLSTIRAAQADGTIRRALVEWKEWGEPEVMAGGTRGEWAIAFTIPSVWWEDESSTVASSSLGATLPKTLNLTGFDGMTGVIEDSIITVLGPITNPRVTDSETGNWVQYTGSVANGASWVIDSGAFTSKIGATSVLSATTHKGNQRFMTIPNCFGTSNTPQLVLSGSAGGGATGFTVSAKRKWASG